MPMQSYRTADKDRR